MEIIRISNLIGVRFVAGDSYYVFEFKLMKMLAGFKKILVVSKVGLELPIYRKIQLLLVRY